MEEVSVAKQEIGVGLIGYQFMGKAHSNAYRQVAHFFDLDAVPVLRAICGRNEEAVKAAAEKFGWQSYETDYRKLIERDDIDLVDVSSPGNMHAPMAIAAAQAGKHVFCEKPLANTLEEAKAMLAAAKKAKVRHFLCHNYRRAPAVALAKRMIEDGTLGKIYHFRATYLQDWIMDPHFPLVWRLDKKVAGSGALGDLGAHIIDLARYLVGEITEISALTETFIKERPLGQMTGGLGAAATGKTGRVTVDDCALFIARFDNGAVGAFEATRFAGGRKNYNRFEINGSGGSVVFNLERMNELEFFNRQDSADRQGFRTILCNEVSQPYGANWWPSGHIIGYEHTFINTVADLIQSLTHGTPFAPDFVDGVRNQAVLDAVERAAKSKKWEKVPRV